MLPTQNHFTTYSNNPPHLSNFNTPTHSYHWCHCQCYPVRPHQLWQITINHSTHNQSRHPQTFFQNHQPRTHSIHTLSDYCITQLRSNNLIWSSQWHTAPCFNHPFDPHWSKPTAPTSPPSHPITSPQSPQTTPSICTLTCTDNHFFKRHSQSIPQQQSVTPIMYQQSNKNTVTNRNHTTTPVLKNYSRHSLFYILTHVPSCMVIIPFTFLRLIIR